MKTLKKIETKTQGKLKLTLVLSICCIWGALQGVPKCCSLRLFTMITTCYHPVLGNFLTELSA